MEKEMKKRKKGKEKCKEKKKRKRKGASIDQFDERRGISTIREA
jgi:hypothetical protein